MPKSKNKTFTVQVKVVAVVDYNIEAETLQEALNKMQNIKTMAIIDDRDGVNDYRHTIVGVFGGEDWDTIVQS